jgi:hypothetical protein
MTRTRRLRAGIAAGLLVTAAAIAVPAYAGAFRVEPYLQQPSEDGMLVTWFTETDAPGRLEVFGRRGRRAWTSAPAYQPLLEYTQAELAEGAAGLPLFDSGSNFKHSVRAEGLAPGERYVYRVVQDGASFWGRFETPPTRERWRSVRFIALADSETQPQGRDTHRAWIPQLAEAPGSEGRPELPVSNAPGENFAAGYLLTEGEGYRENLRIVRERRPDFILMPGDLVQGGGYQPGWDEFFRHNAGEFDNPFSFAPVLPALGNWENFGALNGGYRIEPDPEQPELVKLDPQAPGPGSVNAPFIARSKYKVYFDQPANGYADEQDNFYRVDYGPVTILTLDSSNGEPDVANGDREDPALPDTDTQTNFSRAAFEAAGGTGLSDFNPGSNQYDWLVRQLEDARALGQVVFVQFHHVAYSTGRHSIPIGQFFASGQSGTALRILQPLFEDYGVVAVLSGHNEQFERAFVDLDDDGRGVHHYDVGMAGDGFGAPLSGIDTLFFGADIWTEEQLNPFREWTAWLDEPEVWQTRTDADGREFRQLIDGGIHYGHLEVDLERDRRCRDYATLTMTPVYSFPVTDADYQRVGHTERRVYHDVVELRIGPDGTVVDGVDPASCPSLGDADPRR